jgi:hypothetical protein
MNRNAIHDLLERSQADTSIEEALRVIFAKGDADALVRLGADKGAFLSRDDAEAFIEVIAFSTTRKLAQKNSR